jgi:hypothetical protein
MVVNKLLNRHFKPDNINFMGEETKPVEVPVLGRIVTVVVAEVENGYLITGKRNNGGDLHFVANDIEAANAKTAELLKKPEAAV